MRARYVLLLAAALLAAGCASSSSDSLSEAEGVSALRIRDGMQRLGASEERGDCFARRIARTLDREDEEEAAALVERSASKDDMRESVLSASAPVQRAFIGANMGCSLFG
ncbi:MAG: hypothetical protein RIE56_12600 [Amphiplicatus sp.]